MLISFGVLCPALIFLLILCIIFSPLYICNSSYTVMATPVSVQTVEGSVSKGPKASWNMDMTHKFCDLCIQAISLGMRPGTHFNRAGWKFLTSNFEKETGHKFGKAQLKNKWDGMKKDYKIWRQLVGADSGLGWDSRRGTVDAPDSWWDSKIKALPAAGKFRNAGIDPKLCAKYDAMFSMFVAVGPHAWVPSLQALPIDTSESDEALRQMETGTGEDCSDDSEDPGIIGSVSETAAQLPQGLDRLKRRVDDSFEEVSRGKKRSNAAARLSAQIDRLVTAIESRSEASSRRHIEEERFSITSIMTRLNTLPGLLIGSPVYMFATQYICQRVKREVFVNLPNDETKLAWLQAMYESEGGGRGDRYRLTPITKYS